MWCISHCSGNISNSQYFCRAQWYKDTAIQTNPQTVGFCVSGWETTFTQWGCWAETVEELLPRGKYTTGSPSRLQQWLMFVCWARVWACDHHSGEWERVCARIVGGGELHAKQTDKPLRKKSHLHPSLCLVAPWICSFNPSFSLLSYLWV